MIIISMSLQSVKNSGGLAFLPRSLSRSGSIMPMTLESLLTDDMSLTE